MTFDSIVTPHDFEPSMHTIWSIPELDRCIFCTLPRKELVKVITVSRLFWETTIPLVWHDITLRQLGELFHLGSDHSPSTTPEDGGASYEERREYYAGSVKKLEFGTRISLSYTQALLKHSPLSNYLPNLNQIHLRMDPRPSSPFDPDPEELIRCIALPTLKDLAIAPYDFQFSEKILPALTQALTAVGASLRSLELKGMVPEAPKQLFEVQPAIQTLNIHAHAGELRTAWQAAGTLLPELRSVKFTTEPSQNEAVPVDANKTSFPSLTDVHLSLPNVESLSDFLGCISSPHLRSMRLACTNEGITGCPTSPVQRAAAEHIHRFEQLQTLQLQWWDQTPWDAVISLPQNLSLTYLSIQGGGISTCLGNDAIKTIAQAFPNLERLQIFERTLLHEPPIITFRGLQPLIDSCLKLRRLCIGMDARFEGTITPSAYTREALEELDFRRSRVNSNHVEVMAEFISKLWPNLKRARTAWDGRARDGGEQKRCWDSIWGLVGTQAGRPVGAEAWDQVHI